MGKLDLFEEFYSLTTQPAQAGFAILATILKFIAVLNKVRYALCSMPYALDPRAPHVTEKGYKCKIVS
ncbi:hypothetical protein [Microcoleus sp.]|uniref:hypothetical protein n=1 Tax=Microcoleus sp. TaxID=44472 RepID=UPI00403EF020